MPRLPHPKLPRYGATIGAAEPPAGCRRGMFRVSAGGVAMIRSPVSAKRGGEAGLLCDAFPVTAAIAGFQALLHQTK